MSTAFGWSVEEVERHVVALIQSGDIKGRVDSQNKVSLTLLIFTSECSCTRSNLPRSCRRRNRITALSCLHAPFKLLRICRVRTVNFFCVCVCEYISNNSMVVGSLMGAIISSQQADLVVKAPKGHQGFEILQVD